MKRVLCFFLAFVLVALCGCSAAREVSRNGKYRIMEDAGEYYLVMDKASSISSNGVSASEKMEALTFSSVGEMKQTISEGKYTDEQLAIMDRFFQKTAKGDIALCNTNKLYDATLPEGLTADEIEWYGGYWYTFVFEGELWGFLSVSDKETIENKAAEFAKQPERVKILEKKEVSERNATETLFENLAGEPRKQIQYTFESKDITINIIEVYKRNESDTVPYRVWFYGNSKDAYFNGEFYGFTERPSYEWVTSFGLKPYVETETE